MKDGVFEINDKCVHCSQCHKVEKGCLVYKSLEMPKGGLKMSATKSLNCYSHHAPKMEWFQQYFSYKMILMIDTLLDRKCTVSLKDF